MHPIQATIAKRAVCGEIMDVPLGEDGSATRVFVSCMNGTLRDEVLTRIIAAQCTAGATEASAGTALLPMLSRIAFETICDPETKNRVMTDDSFFDEFSRKVDIQTQMAIAMIALKHSMLTGEDIEIAAGNSEGTPSDGSTT